MYDPIVTDPSDTSIPITGRANIWNSNETQVRVSNQTEPRPILYLKRKSENKLTLANEGIFNNWKKTTAEYFKDCSALVRKIKENEFGIMHMKEIVEYYNDICAE